MLSYKMFVEAFDSSYDFQKMQDDRYKFSDENGREFVVSLDSYEGNYEVEFGNMVNGRIRYSLTKDSKNPMKVYSTIRKIIFHHLEKDKHKDSMTFSVADPRTANLYWRFANDIAKRFNGTAHRLNGIDFKVTF